MKTRHAPGGGSGGGESSGSQYRFEPHARISAFIKSRGEKATNCADKFEELKNDIGTLHERGYLMLLGDLRITHADADKPAKNQCQTMYRRAAVSGAALTKFGEAVSKFNSKVDELNAQLRDADNDDDSGDGDGSARKELYEELKEEYNDHKRRLRSEAEESSDDLRDWPQRQNDQKSLEGRCTTV